MEIFTNELPINSTKESWNEKMSTLTTLAAFIAIVIFTGLSIFHLLLVLGKPYGKAVMEENMKSYLRT